MSGQEREREEGETEGENMVREEKISVKSGVKLSQRKVEIGEILITQ